MPGWKCTSLCLEEPGTPGVGGGWGLCTPEYGNRLEAVLCLLPSAHTDTKLNTNKIRARCALLAWTSVGGDPGRGGVGHVPPGGGRRSGASYLFKRPSASPRNTSRSPLLPSFTSTPSLMPPLTHTVCFFYLLFNNNKMSLFLQCFFFFLQKLLVSFFKWKCKNVSFCFWGWGLRFTSSCICTVCVGGGASMLTFLLLSSNLLPLHLPQIYTRVFQPSTYTLEKNKL